MGLHPLPGYPCPNEKGGYDWVGDVDGPTSYVNSGTFGTSGQQLNAQDFGFGGFEIVDAPALSSDGVNDIVLVMGATTGGATALSPSPGAGQSGPAVQTAVLHWFTAIRGVGANPTEVANATNLSAKMVRLRIAGV
jgi:hypothetical protein